MWRQSELGLILGVSVALSLSACEKNEDAGDAGASGGQGGHGGSVVGGSGGAAGGTGGAIGGGSGGTGGSGGVSVGGGGGSGGVVVGGSGGTGGVVVGGSGGSGGVVVGGSGGTGGTGGVVVGGAGGEGGSGGAVVGGAGGEGGGIVPCEGPNPQGCIVSGCPDDQYCAIDIDACVSSGCVCDEGTGSWACLPDCGGGLCMPLPVGTQWYLTCGDPVCRGHQPDPNIPPCDAAMMAGAACDHPGQMCDPGDECNARLVCTDSDPRMQPGGCPISKRSFKDDIRYLPAAEVDERAAALLAVKLAEYRYRTEAQGGTPHLGFIIDDGVPTGALRPSKDQVDLYGYTTLAVAAVQAQARQLDALRAEMEALKAEMAAQAARCSMSPAAP